MAGKGAEGLSDRLVADGVERRQFLQQLRGVLPCSEADERLAQAQLLIEHVLKKRTGRITFIEQLDKVRSARESKEPRRKVLLQRTRNNRKKQRA